MRIEEENAWVYIQREHMSKQNSTCLDDHQINAYYYMRRSVHYANGQSPLVGVVSAREKGRRVLGRR